MYTKTTLKEFDESTGQIIKTTNRNFSTGYDANFNTSLSTKLFMDYVFKSKRLKQIRDLLIPSLAYTYRPDFGKEQYGFWKEIATDVPYVYRGGKYRFSKTVYFQAQCKEHKSLV